MQTAAGFFSIWDYIGSSSSVRDGVTPVRLAVLGVHVEHRATVI